MQRQSDSRESANCSIVPSTTRSNSLQQRPRTSAVGTEAAGRPKGSAFALRRSQSGSTAAYSGISSVVYGWLITVLFQTVDAQTEGDTGYDYNDAYEDEYDDESVVGMDPSFDVPIVNVTVVAGQTAVLPCSIEYLGKFKVAWLDHSSIPLTYEDRRIVDDARFTVVRPATKEWNLQIRDIRPDDQGQYRCTINTSPVKSKVIMLHVKVPAAIIDELSTDDQTVQEGETVILICNVTGVPPPEVTWYRRPASSKSSDRKRIEQERPGEMIIIHNVTRYCDDIYECVASNGVPPSVSRQIRVTVEFAPEISMPNRRLGQAKGRETILECIITAYPHAVNYWEKDGHRISSSAKHRIEAYDDGEHTIVLSLRIHDIEQKDYGEYKCVASNPLGQDQQVMYLYEYLYPDSLPHGTGTLSPSGDPRQQLPYPRHQHQQPVTGPRRSDRPGHGASPIGFTPASTARLWPGLATAAMPTERYEAHPSWSRPGAVTSGVGSPVNSRHVKTDYSYGSAAAVFGRSWIQVAAFLTLVIVFNSRHTKLVYI